MTLHADTSEMVCSQTTFRQAAKDLADKLGVEIQVRFPADRETQQIAVLCTKESHCLEAIFEARQQGELDAEVGLVLSNRSRLAGLAEDFGVPFYDVGDEKGSPDEARMLDILAEHGADLIVLARYMRILSPNIVFRYEDRIINIHPSLLPSFPGGYAYQQAEQEGVRIAGVTAHYVTTDLDQGPIITQRAFNVPDAPDADAIKELGQPLEADALLEAIELHLHDDITVHHGRTRLRDDRNRDDYQLGMDRRVAELTPEGPVDRSLDS
jgi:formyltetrahydrofolate deformylase